MASRMASGELVIDRLIPEGFDDLQLDAPEPVQMEVKSRQEHLGPFPIGRAASHIVDAWLRHTDRFGTDRRLVVVLEQGIVGWGGAPEDHLVEIPVARLVEEVEGLGASLAAGVASRGRPPTVVDELKICTTLLICSWDDLIAGTECHLGIVVKNLPKAALGVIGRDLQSMVAAAVDANAEAGFEARSGLDRTGLVDKINSLAELIDLDSIEYALVQGICGPVNRQPIAIGDAYYEGVSTQPGHVAAGLVVPRPDLVEQVMASLEMKRPVLLVGPSGVGKSAVLWTLPFALPGILWFGVHRISDDDLPHIVRLLKAYRPSTGAPVGLLVDAAGTGDLEGWSRLGKAVAAIPGVFLAGSARREDLLSLGALADCTIVPVSLDEDAAAAIHSGLIRRGATNVPHWREAFEQAHGLTLEFTHLLTQGTRLSDVIADQVADRVRGGRSLELHVLTLVATADKWSASIPIVDLEAGAGASSSELRVALERLVKEHLLVEHGGVVGGIHQIRSRAIVDVIHRIPPPELKATVESVLKMLHGPALSRFLYEVLRDVPALEEPVLHALEGLAQDVESLIACLRGLEMLDFYRQASAWAEIAERHDVPPALRPLVLQFSIAGIDAPGIFPDQVRNATAEMASLPAQSATMDALLGTVGLTGIASELSAATSADVCLRLLRSVRLASIDWRPLLTALEPGSPLIDALQGWSLPTFGDCVSAAGDVSLGLARAFVDAAGGTEGILRRFHDSDPWIRELQVASVEGELVGVARFLYISESEQGDARERAVETGRQLLRTLPDISKVDVKAILPGGRALEIGGIEHGSSGLLRQNDHHLGAIAWNQDRIRLAQSLFGTNETERLAQAAELLDELAKLVRDYGNAFVRSRGEADDPKALFTRRSALYAKGRLLPPRLVTSPFSGENRVELHDSLSALVTEVCDKVLPRLGNADQHKAVSAYIENTVLGTYIPKAREQPWRLLGFQDPPLALGELSIGLSDIVAVLTELSAGPDSVRKVINAGRSGTAQRALSRAAEKSRRWTRRRVQERRRAMTTALRSTGLKVDVIWPDGEPLKGGISNFAISVSVESLADWPTVLGDIVPKLEDLRIPGESPLLVPLLKGRSVVPCAMKLITKLWPAIGLGEFEHLLPPPLDQRLTTPVINAHSALQVCSGISTLGREGGLPDQVGQFLERTLNAYNDATAAIRSLEGSNVLIAGIVDWLTENDERVAGEFSGEIEAGTFAASMTEGNLGDGSADADALQGVLTLSLQWDSDPASAVALFESLEM